MRRDGPIRRPSGSSEVKQKVYLLWTTNDSWRYEKGNKECFRNYHPRNLNKEEFTFAFNKEVVIILNIYFDDMFYALLTFWTTLLFERTLVILSITASYEQYNNVKMFEHLQKIKVVISFRYFRYWKIKKRYNMWV